MCMVMLYFVMVGRIESFEVSISVVLALSHGEVLTDILVLGAIARVCCCDLAIGVSPVIDPVYLEYSTKNKNGVFISFYPDASVDGWADGQVDLQ